MNEMLSNIRMYYIRIKFNEGSRMEQKIPTKQRYKISVW
jgi:hypothetical protein